MVIQVDPEQARHLVHRLNDAADELALIEAALAAAVATLAEHAAGVPAPHGLTLAAQVEALDRELNGITLPLSLRCRAVAAELAERLRSLAPFLEPGNRPNRLFAAWRGLVDTSESLVGNHPILAPWLKNRLLTGGATRVDSGRTGPLTSLADIAGRGRRLSPNQLEIVHAGGDRYVVVLRGIGPNMSAGPQTLPGAWNALQRGDDPMTTGAMDAVRRAGVPAQAKLMIVGHSQGGLVAMNLAGNRDFTARYQVTHVLTAGAPIDHKRVILPSRTAVLHLENSHDYVPALDGQRRGPANTTYSFARKADPHGYSTYLAEMSTPAFRADPRVQEFLVDTNGYATGSDARFMRFDVEYEWKWRR